MEVGQPAGNPENEAKVVLNGLEIRLKDNKAVQDPPNKTH